MAFFSPSDDALFGGGMGLLGGVFNNVMSGFRQDDSQDFSAEQSAISRAFNAQQAQTNRDFQLGTMREQNSYNAAEAANQRAWTEQMSSTAYQRTMADMKAAGLNPMLAYMNKSTPVGGGATASSGAPSGSSASSTPVSSHAAPVFDVIQPALSTALSFKRLENETKLADAEAELKRQNARTDAVRAGAVAEQAGLSNMQTRKLQAEQPAAEATGAKGKSEKSFYDSAIGDLLVKTGLGGSHSAKTLEPVSDFARRFGSWR